MRLHKIVDPTSEVIPKTLYTAKNLKTLQTGDSLTKTTTPSDDDDQKNGTREARTLDLRISKSGI
jgi:hypothetical protein